MVFQSKELTLTECCRLTYSMVQDNVLRDELKLGVGATKAQCGKTIISECTKPLPPQLSSYWATISFPSLHQTLPVPLAEVLMGFDPGMIWIR
eukprot:g32029.t1